LLNERVAGFHKGFLLLVGSRFNEKVKINNKLLSFVTDGAGNPPGNTDWYFVEDRLVKIIVDGVPLSLVYQLTEIRDITAYLTTHAANDIKGIEVNFNSKYTLRYVPIGVEISPADVAFIEITTRAASGPSMPYTPGTYLYRPMPFSLPKQFYQPKYTIKNKDTAAKDLRSTVAWYPNIITDKEGKATVSFYSSDRTGTYTLILEGTDINGTLGSYRRKIILFKK